MGLKTWPGSSNQWVTELEFQFSLPLAYAVCPSPPTPEHQPEWVGDPIGGLKDKGKRVSNSVWMGKHNVCDLPTVGPNVL